MAVISNLFLKVEKDKPMLSCDSFYLEKSYGIKGDLNSAIGSPRQVLIASLPVIKQFKIKPDDLRANIVINENIEEFKSGQVIQIGNKAKIRLTFHCEPCYKLDEVQKGLAKKIIGQRGFLGMIIESGEIKINDKIILTDEKYPFLSDSAKERFVEFINRIPIGKVIKTSDIILALGLAKGYYRAIPSYLKSFDGIIPTYRIVNVQGELMEKYIFNQKDKLINEGIEFTDNRVKDDYYWQAENFYS